MAGDSDVDTRVRSSLPRRGLALAALTGLVLRLAFGLLYWTDKPLTRDEFEYLSLARNLAAGNGFTYGDDRQSDQIAPFGRAPGYPAFLAAVGGGTAPAPHVPRAVQIAQSLAGAAGVWLVGVLACRLAGRRAALAAAALAAVYPPLVWIAGYALSEALFWPVGLAVAWAFDRTLATSPRVGPALATGLLVGLGILVRPALVLFVPIALMVLLWRRAPGVAVALALGVVVTVGPWTFRNYAQYGRLMFVASEGGVTFWTGNHPLAVGDGDMAANPAIKLDNQRFRNQHPGLTEEQAEPIYYREALEWIVGHPLDWMALEFRKLFHLVVPIGPSYTLHSSRYYALSVLSYATVLVLALAGLGRLHVPGSFLGLWVLVGSAVLTALVFLPQERFRIPIIDPALVVLAGAAIASWSNPRSHHD